MNTNLQHQVDIHRASERPPRAQKRRGAVVVLIALLLPVLFILVGFSIDLANIQRTITELRTATDLATKASTDTLARTGSTTLAIAKGKEIAAANDVAGDGLTLVDTDFEFGQSQRLPSGKWDFVVSATDQNGVRLNGSRLSGSADGPVSLMFGNLFGATNFEPQLTASGAFPKIAVCLVLDRSSSMKKALTESGGLPLSDPRWCLSPNLSARWRGLDTAVTVFLDEILATPWQEHLAMVSFGGPLSSPPTCSLPCDFSTVSIDVNLTTNVASVQAAMTSRMNSLWNGKTDIAAGLQTGISVLQSAPSHMERVIIILTDGEYTEASPIPLSLTAAANDITVHTVTFGTGLSPTAIADMQTIATNTGGLYLPAPSAQSLKDAFKELAEITAVLIQ